MSFERVSYKGDIFARKGENDTEWVQKSHKDELPIATCNIEITGETSPLALCDASKFSKLSLKHPYVYHYTWTVGLTGRIGFDWLYRLDEEDAVLVQLIINGGNSRFVSREVFATLEYLPPTKNLKEEPSFLEWCKTVLLHSGELVESTGSHVAGLLATTIGNIIPSDSDGFSKWFLHKFDVASDSNQNEHSYGVEWHISRSLIQEVGSRLVGRLGVVFLDAPFQTENPENNSNNHTVRIQGRVGLKHKPDKGHWWGFSMIPFWDSDSLILKVNPQSYSRLESE
jgi:hypothetical protein